MSGRIRRAAGSIGRAVANVWKTIYYTLHPAEANNFIIRCNRMMDMAKSEGDVLMYWRWGKKLREMEVREGLTPRTYRL